MFWLVSELDVMNARVQDVNENLKRHVGLQRQQNVQQNAIQGLRDGGALLQLSELQRGFTCKARTNKETDWTMCQKLCTQGNNTP